MPSSDTPPRPFPSLALVSPSVCPGILAQLHMLTLPLYLGMLSLITAKQFFTCPLKFSQSSLALWVQILHPDTWFAVFSHGVCSLHLPSLQQCHWVRSFYSQWRSVFQHILSFIVVLVLQLRNCCVTKDHRFLSFVLEILVSGFTFGSVVYFELPFTYAVSYDQNLSYCMWISGVPASFIEDGPSSTSLSCTFVDCMCTGLLLDSVLCYLLVSLSVCQFHTYFKNHN